MSDYLQQQAPLLTDASGRPVGFKMRDGREFLFTALMQAVMQSGIARGIPPTGTIGVNGALTLGTALHVIYTQGAYMYFPAGAINAGSVAGIYWVVMSSTTVGTVYNNTYTGGKPVAPAVPTPFVGTTGIAYTQDTAEITVGSYTLPGSSLGIDGQLHTTAVVSMSITAGNKTLREKLGGSNIYSIVSASAGTIRAESNVANNGAGRQKITNTGAAFGTGAAFSSALTQISVDTTVDQLFVHTLQLATATDWAFIDYERTEAWPS